MARTYRRDDELATIRSLVRLRAEQSHAGVFRRSDLAPWGVDPRIIPVMLRRQWWARLHHGVYVDRDVLHAATSPVAVLRLNAAATVVAIEGPAHLFGVSAAILHDLPVDRALLGPVEIVRPIGQDSRALRRRITATDRLAPPTVHQHTLPEADGAVVAGLPVVSPLLAAVSAAARSNREWAVVTLDAACWQSQERVDRIPDLVREWSRLRGIGTVRRAAPLVRTGSQTPLESLSRIRLLDEGLPEPELQVPLHDSRGLIGYVDMLWRELRVVGEADGAVKYAVGSALMQEKIREDRIRALGFPVVRWTWDEILREPGQVAARIRAAATIQRRLAR